MPATRQELKEEALKRMKFLQLDSSCIRSFKSADHVWTSEHGGMLYDDEEVQELVKQVEQKKGGLVYHVILNYTDVGKLYSMLYISENDEEWQADWEDLQDKYVFAYVLNEDEPLYSEFGTIIVKPMFGGLARIG